MATVEIGGRTLDVRPATCGFVRRRAELGHKLKAAKDDVEAADTVAEILMHYLGHNDGVTPAWLLDVVPWYQDFSEPFETLMRCAEAAGQKPERPTPGEAPRP
jgi:hypothetical protein